MLFAGIFISVFNKAVDKPFWYVIPEPLEQAVELGSRVLVPFGKGDKVIEGWVADVSDVNPVGGVKMKSVVRVLGESAVFTKEALTLASWLADKYYSTMGECLTAVVPAGLRLGKQRAVNEGRNTVRFAEIAPDVEVETDSIIQKGGKQADVLSFLREFGGCAVNEIKLYAGVSASPIETLVKKGIITIDERPFYRDVLDTAQFGRDTPPPLTVEQQHAYAAITRYINNEPTKPILLRGVTGSGKTEVYLRVLADVLAQGKQGIVLVPEIALTPQTVAFFASRFGDVVTVTHSRLSAGERLDQWRKAKEGRVSVIVGPRSAVFAPFPNLGVIIIDEEHEKTYKSETSPKYDARIVAEKRAELTGCSVILGSATPSVGSYNKAVETGEYNLAEMNNRVNGRTPDITVVDMREELARHNISIFSDPLFEAIERNIERGEQSILFLNRRGHSTFVSCRQCGYVLTCDSCSVNYTYHMFDDRLLCHYCGRTAQTPSVCPVCSSKYIRYFGIGTQKLEDDIKKLFPEARVLRMDADATSTKDAHERIINAFAEGEADILIGTQMVAKGLNFPKLSLVGIMAADAALNTGDFASAETAYQLMTQVSGRAGRAETDGRVFIQTYNPEHYSIRFARENDYVSFYEHEINVRRDMCYPPFSHIFAILFSGTDEKMVITSLFRLASYMNAYNRKGFFDILGPAPCVIAKINKNYRRKLLIKGVDEPLLKQFVFFCLEKYKKAEKPDVSVSINLTLDPNYSQ